MSAGKAGPDGTGRPGGMVRAGLIALAYAVLLYVAVYLESGFLYFIVGLVVTPFCICALYLSLADPAGQNAPSRAVKHCLLLMAAVLAITVLVFHEGIICILMAAPIFLFMGLLAIPVTRWFQSSARTRRAPLLMLVLPLVGMPVERQADYPARIEHVRTMIDIRAPAAKVWDHTVEITDIADRERIPSFSHSVIGLPGPVDARMEGTGIGAVRHLRWQQGVHFQEIVTDWRPGELLAWDFRFQPDSIPRHIEAHVRVDADYLRILGGKYELSALPDGGTRVTLTSWYHLATPFNDYCAWWGQVFLDDFHEAVLHIIKERAERAVTSAKAEPT
ncbi:SRPBCC family protein [Niveispirillum sp. KHB5.9]|uniref:SRPBCC family protein n=1 Tax=Niveispirillum sp. KHB5.9 TaxID=3400269 RepID=UPI003A8B2A7B